MDDDDLAQVAYIALLRSLQQFRYRSPCVAWASRVIVFSVRLQTNGAYALFHRKNKRGLSRVI